MTIDFRIKLGKKIKELREAKKMSREDLAFGTGVSGSYIGMIERGEYDFKITKIYNIAKTLKIPLAKIFEKL